MTQTARPLILPIERWEHEATLRGEREFVRELLRGIYSEAAGLGFPKLLDTDRGGHLQIVTAADWLAFSRCPWHSPGKLEAVLEVLRTAAWRRAGCPRTSDLDELFENRRKQQDK